MLLLKSTIFFLYFPIRILTEKKNLSLQTFISSKFSDWSEVSFQSRDDLNLKIQLF